MSQDWIKMRKDLPTDPAVVAVAVATGLDEDAVCGKLLRLWAWADSHLTDGNAPSVTASWVDRNVRHDGFARALVSAGWLVEVENGITIPNFERHMGASAKKRGLTAKRVTAHRASSNAPSVTSVTHRALPEKEKEKEKEKEVKKAAPRAWSLDDLKWPTGIDAPETRASMAAWVEHKRTKGKAYKGTQGPQAILNMFASHGPAALSKQIQYSLAGNYEGVYEPNGNGSAKAPSGPAPVVDELARHNELFRKAELVTARINTPHDVEVPHV